MRLIYLFFISALIILLATSSVSNKSSNGIAGYTGAPGGFGTCGNPGCHSGGSSSASGITITAVPAFTNNEYMPDSTYNMTIQVAAAGFSRYGFDCEILTPNGVNAGVISSNIGQQVKTLNAGSRKDAVHTSPRFGSGGTSFVFPWKAPASGTVIVYAIANAINGNGSTSGDFPLTPTKLNLTPHVEPVDTTITTSVTENDFSTDLKLYPNPATVFATMEYYLNVATQVTISITDIKGTNVLKVAESNVQAGSNSQSLDLRSLAPGAYFVNVSTPEKKLAQKLLLVN